VPVSASYLASVVAALEAARPVTHRKMFGGLGVYLDGVFFAVVDDDRLYFKVDDGNLAGYDALGMEPWFPDPTSTKPSPYREVPADVLADVEALGEWVDASVAAAVRLKRK
jgi:DNA transformation protein and related proteins